MSNDHPTTYGPEFLEDYADKLSSIGDSQNAIAFRQAAKSWSSDRTQRDQAFDENSDLQRRINAASRTLAPATV
jgi:hypothetical protein